MPDKPLNLLRCNNCFILRIEQDERHCPICAEGTLKITATKFKLEKIDIHPVQDLLKRLMKTDVSKDQLTREVQNMINVAPIIAQVKQRINDYLFCGHPISLPLPAPIEKEINIAASDSVSDLVNEARKIGQAIDVYNTDSIIEYVQLKRNAEYPGKSSGDVFRNVHTKLDFVASNDLVCCDECLTLYRSLGLKHCIFCGSPSIYRVWKLTKPNASGSEILSKLIESAEESGFDHIQPVLSAFLLTYHLGKKESGPKTFLQIKAGLQEIQWKKTSLLDIHAQLYDLMERLKPLLRREPNSFYDSAADVFEELPRRGVAGAIIQESTQFDTYDDEPLPQDSSLSASLYCPFEVPVEEGFLIQVFIHEADLAAKIKELAVSADPDSAKRFESALNINTKELQRLDISFLSDDIDADEKKYSLKWRGGMNSVQFIGTIPKACMKATVFGTIIIAADSVPIGHMKFKIKVLTDPVKKQDQNLTINAIPFEKYKKIFISYASSDRNEVLKRVQILNALKIDFFQDVLSLEPGDNWEDALYSRIQVSDAFFLFWSTAAASSSWVKKEIIYALNIKRGKEENPPHIIPIIIEGPPPPAPPAELAFLHFNDKLLYFMK